VQQELKSNPLGGHLFQAIRSRTWFMLGTAVLCGILEILGWSGRLWAHYDPLGATPFQIQSVHFFLSFNYSFVIQPLLRPSLSMAMVY
jgi:hypothetical protein